MKRGLQILTKKGMINGEPAGRQARIFGITAKK